MKKMFAILAAKIAENFNNRMMKSTDD